MRLIYLDNNATTMPAPEVVTEMVRYLTEVYGNPSSIHRFGQLARRGIDEARQKVAELVNCSGSEITFTSGATESVNTVLRTFLNLRAPRKRLVVSTVEHSATRETAQELARQGFEVVEVPVDREGCLDLNRLEEAVNDDTALVSMMYANNETGVLFPVEQIGEICRRHGVPYHSDITQAVGKIPVDLKVLPVDAASFAPHKFHGPKGVGLMYVRRGQRFKPLMFGGPQERMRRGGTENVPGIVGAGVSAELARRHLPDMPKVAAMRDRFERTLLDSIADSCVNGCPGRRVPNTSNLSFAAIESEAILISLSELGVCASAGSACGSGSLEPSPVLRAMGVPHRIGFGAVRFSLSRYTTDDEIDAAIEIVTRVVSRLRAVLPVG